MISLFSKSVLDQQFFKYNYIKMPIQTHEKIENKLVLIIDENAPKSIVALVMNKEDVGYNIKLMSDVESINDDVWKSIGIQLHTTNEVRAIDTQGIILNVNIWIETIAEYIIVCQNLSSKNTLYRGQANKDWRLEPSIFRKEVNLEKEYQMYRDILQWNNEIFNTNDLIQYVCNMQHYGIPTRLMDWTSNPLHALYFATVNVSEKNSDGMVLNLSPERIIEVDTEEYNDLNTFLANRYRLDNKMEATEINRVLQESSDANKGYLFFKAKYSNSRIKAQQGYFSIYRDIISDEIQSLRESKANIIEGQIQKYLKGKFDRGTSTKVKHIILNNTNIEEMLNEIEEKINLEFNPGEELQEVKEYIKGVIETSKISTIVNKEQCMTEILKYESYVKIMIQSDLKEQLIQDLDILGINSRVVYPDVQGLAQYMKEKYQ